jgi:hypothetical protein
MHIDHCSELNQIESAPYIEVTTLLLSEYKLKIKEQPVLAKG